MNVSASPGLLGRIAALAVLLVFFQIGVVSEVPLFGVSADLSPLLVAFVGLLCGSTLGAVTGFGVGLLVDLALVQTLGVTSLTLTVVGYFAVQRRAAPGLVMWMTSFTWCREASLPPGRSQACTPAHKARSSTSCPTYPAPSWTRFRPATSSAWCSWP